jgi:hypothetical protein
MLRRLESVMAMLAYVVFVLLSMMTPIVDIPQDYPLHV